MIFRVAYCSVLLLLAVACGAAPINAGNFEETLAEDGSAFVVLVSDSALSSEFKATWTSLANEVKKVKTATIEIETDAGKLLAQKALKGVEFPAIVLFNAGIEQPKVLSSGEPGTPLKSVRKRLKKGFKGLTKNADGLFQRKQSCDADDPFENRAKFLIYDVGPGERFNMRKAILTERVVPLMLNLQELDPTWTLGLSPFRQFGQQEHEKWSDMFDSEKLKGLLPGMNMVEAADYFTWRPTVDLVYFFGTCPPGIEERENFPHKLFGHDVTVKKCKCASSYRPNAHDKEFAERVNGLVKGASASAPQLIFVTNFEEVMPEHAFEKKDVEIKLARRSLVRFNQKMFDAAEAFHQTAMGGGKYLSMHWRQGDFLRANKELPSVEEIAAAVLAKAKEHDITKFVLLTNGDKASVAKLSDALKEGGVALFRYAKEAFETREATDMNYPGQDGFTSLQVATIEQALAAKATVFFGSTTSTFSKQVHLERRVLGYSWEDESCVTLFPEGVLAKMCFQGAHGVKCEPW